MKLLSVDEKNLVSQYLKLRARYTVLFVLFLFLAVGYYIFIFGKFIPAYLSSLDKFPDTKTFLQSGFVSLARIGLALIALSLCLLMGGLIAQSKIHPILRRMLD